MVNNVALGIPLTAQTIPTTYSIKRCFDFSKKLDRQMYM